MHICKEVTDTGLSDSSKYSPWVGQRPNQGAGSAGLQLCRWNPGLFYACPWHKGRSFSSSGSSCWQEDTCPWKSFHHSFLPPSTLSLGNYWIPGNRNPLLWPLCLLLLPEDEPCWVTGQTKLAHSALGGLVTLARLISAFGSVSLPSEWQSS